MNLGRTLFKTNLFLGLYLLLIFLLGVYKLYGLDVVDQSGWILGDWLIHFQGGGFKRRGLSGTFFFFLQDLTGARLQTLVFVFQSLCYLILFVFFFRSLTKIKDLRLILLCVLSPSLLMAYVNDSLYLGRKDVLFVVVFLVFCSVLYNNISKIGLFFLLPILLITSLFFHEALFFLLPFFVFVLRQNQASLKTMALYNLVFCMVFGGISHFTSPIESVNPEVLLQRGVHLTDGIMNFSSSLDTFVTNPKMVICGLIYVFVFCFVLFQNWIIHFEKKQQKSWILLMILGLVFMLPLFVFAKDWGRWLHLNSMFLVIVLLFEIQKNSVLNSEPYFSSPKQSVLDLALLGFVFVYLSHMQDFRFAVPRYCNYFKDALDLIISKI